MTAIFADSDGGDLALGRVIDDEALAVRADAVDQPTAVGAGDQVALMVEGHAANMLLIALEEEFRLRSGLGDIHTVDCRRAAGGDVEPSFGVKEQVPDVFWLLGRGGGIEGDQWLSCRQGRSHLA